MEAKKLAREIYTEQISNIPKSKLVYIDESSVDQNCYKNRGWGKKGQLLIGKRSGKYIKRTNIIAGYRDNKVIAPLIFTDSCNTALVIKWVSEYLIKTLNPGDVVIMDNAAFHKSSRIRELIESVGCKLIYLPPYSPDLNPIEKFWANMKRWIKSTFPILKNSWDAIMDFINAQTSL